MVKLMMHRTKSKVIPRRKVRPRAKSAEVPRNLSEIKAMMIKWMREEKKSE